MDIFSLGVLSYFLLCGVLPFQGKSEEEIAKYILNNLLIRKSIECNLNFNLPKWKELSKDAKDFISSIYY